MAQTTNNKPITNTTNSSSSTSSSQRTVTHDSLHYINILTYLLTVHQQITLLHLLNLNLNLFQFQLYSLQILLNVWGHSHRYDTELWKENTGWLVPCEAHLIVTTSQWHSIKIFLLTYLLTYSPPTNYTPTSAKFKFKFISISTLQLTDVTECLRSQPLVWYRIMKRKHWLVSTMWGPPNCDHLTIALWTLESIIIIITAFKRTVWCITPKWHRQPIIA